MTLNWVVRGGLSEDLLFDLGFDKEESVAQNLKAVQPRWGKQLV